jgi:polyhydroxyalkanoate synthesis regulator phasin
VRDGKISAADARAMAEKIAAEGKREFEDVSAKVGDKVREFLAYSDSKYLSRIEALELRVAVLEGTPAKTSKPRAKS